MAVITAAPGEIARTLPLLSTTATEYAEKKMHFQEGIQLLTPTEQAIYNFYLERKTAKEIMELLNIKENTLKFHNKNIYSKLGVVSFPIVNNCPITIAFESVPCPICFVTATGVSGFTYCKINVSTLGT